MTKKDKRFLIICALVVLIPASIGLYNLISAQGAGDPFRIYDDCITRQIEAGSPTWAETTAACESKYPKD